jgi:hypothetical protein
MLVLPVTVIPNGLGLLSPAHFCGRTRLAPVMNALPPSGRDRLTVNRITGAGDMSAVRAALAAMTAGPPPLPAVADLTPSLPQAGGVPGQWVNTTGRPAVEAGVTLYAHGGGFEHRNAEFERHGACVPPGGPVSGTAAGRDHFPGALDGVDRSPAWCRHPWRQAAGRQLMSNSLPSGSFIPIA